MSLYLSLNLSDIKNDICMRSCLVSFRGLSKKTSLLKRYIWPRVHSIPHHCARLSHSALRDGTAKSIRRNANTANTQTHSDDIYSKVQLILCWSVIGASWLDYCVGRCSLAPGDGEHCSRGICRCPRRPAYRNNLHAGNSSETNCNSSYYLRRTRYNFEKGERREGRGSGGGRGGQPARGNISRWLMAMRPRASVFCCTFFFIARTVSSIRGMRIGARRWWVRARTPS